MADENESAGDAESNPTPPPPKPSVDIVSRVTEFSHSDDRRETGSAGGRQTLTGTGARAETDED